MQVMVPQHGKRAVAQGFNKTQGLQRFGTAVHQVATKPERIFGRIKIDFLQ
jgi:hypothetical protein